MSDIGTDDGVPGQTLGTLLREVRELLGFSVRGAAERVKISATYLSQLESGAVKDPSPRILYNLSDSYGMPYDDLMRAAGYIVPGLSQDGPLHLLDIALRTTEPLTDDERQALIEYLAWYRSRHGRPPEKR